MGPSPILSVIHTVTIGTMLNFNGSNNRLKSVISGTHLWIFFQHDITHLNFNILWIYFRWRCPARSLVYFSFRCSSLLFIVFQGVFSLLFSAVVCSGLFFACWSREAVCCSSLWWCWLKWRIRNSTFCSFLQGFNYYKGKTLILIGSKYDWRNEML